MENWLLIWITALAIILIGIMTHAIATVELEKTLTTTNPNNNQTNTPTPKTWTTLEYTADITIGIGAILLIATTITRL